MYAILKYEGKIISFDLATTPPACLDYFTTNGAEIIEYRNFR